MPVFEDFYVMKVSKHLCMLLSTVELIFAIIIHWLTLSKNVKESKTVAARLIIKGRIYEHLNTILRELHWLPVNERIMFKILLFTYTALLHVAPLHIYNTY